jgi:hypothetical protein
MKNHKNSKHFSISIALAVLTMMSFSCRDFSIDAGQSALTCAASSVAVKSGSQLAILDPAHGGNEIAQSFVPQATVKNVNSVQLALQSVGSLGNSTVTVSILGNRNGQPDFSNSLTLATSVIASGISTSGQMVTFSFSKPISALNAGTTYWIVVDANYYWNGFNYVNWLGADSSNSTTGQALVYNGQSWASPDSSGAAKRALAFQIGCL